MYTGNEKSHKDTHILGKMHIHKTLRENKVFSSGYSPRLRAAKKLQKDYLSTEPTVSWGEVAVFSEVQFLTTTTKKSHPIKRGRKTTKDYTVEIRQSYPQVVLGKLASNTKAI